MAASQVNTTAYKTLLQIFSGSQSPNNTGIVMDTHDITYMAVDLTLTSFTGGTTPAIQFFVDRLGADGVWYNAWSSQSSGTAFSNTFDLGPGFASSGPPNGSQHVVFTGQARFRWATTGSPTAVTFSASCIAR